MQKFNKGSSNKVCQKVTRGMKRKRANNKCVRKRKSRGRGKRERERGMDKTNTDKNKNK